MYKACTSFSALLLSALFLQCMFCMRHMEMIERDCYCSLTITVVMVMVGFSGGTS